MAYNSTIKPKIGFCVDCPEGSEEKNLIAGRCGFHYGIHRQKVRNARQKLQTDIRGLIINDTSADLVIWFAEKIRLVKANPYCTECGAWIPPKFYKHAVAHIFPKSIFLSVATHPLNFVIVGAGCGCHDKTHTIETFSKMKIFPLAVERFFTFRSSIVEQHKYLNLFNEAIKNKT